MDGEVTGEPSGLGAVVADDDPDIRALISIAVRRAKIDLLVEAADGQEAWAAVSRFRPGLAVLDVSMPGMTGLEVCRLIRADDTLAGIRVVLLSAAVDEQSRAAGMAAGADEFLAKPFSPRELAERLSAIVAGACVP